MEILAREYTRNTLGNMSFVRVLLGVVKYPGRDWELRRLEATTVRTFSKSLAWPLLIVVVMRVVQQGSRNNKV